MKAFVLLCGLLLALKGIAHGALLSRDLGQGLVYQRIHQLPADLPTDEAVRRQPCILDLRYVSCDGAATAALVAWLRFHATEHAPVFVLANSNTAPILLSAFTTLGKDPCVIVIGSSEAGFSPDIAVRISAEAERLAYDAVEHGASLDSLIIETPDKPRNDEAQLAKERQSDSAASEDPSAPPLPNMDTVKPKQPLPMIDAVLQRAVQLHRTLLALKKL